eukprot:681991-Ditylum_brightwellii.AAC.1
MERNAGVSPGVRSIWWYASTRSLSLTNLDHHPRGSFPVENVCPAHFSVAIVNVPPGWKSDL